MEFEETSNQDDSDQLSPKEMEEIRATPRIDSPLQVRPIVLSNPNMILLVFYDALEKPICRTTIEKEVLKELFKDMEGIWEEAKES